MITHYQYKSSIVKQGKKILKGEPSAIVSGMEEVSQDEYTLDGVLEQELREAVEIVLFYSVRDGYAGFAKVGGLAQMQVCHEQGVRVVPEGGLVCKKAQILAMKGICDVFCGSYHALGPVKLQ